MKFHVPLNLFYIRPCYCCGHVSFNFKYMVVTHGCLEHNFHLHVPGKYFYQLWFSLTRTVQNRSSECITFFFAVQICLHAGVGVHSPCKHPSACLNTVRPNDIAIRGDMKPMGVSSTPAQMGPAPVRSAGMMFGAAWWNIAGHIFQGNQQPWIFADIAFRVHWGVKQSSGHFKRVSTAVGRVMFPMWWSNIMSLFWAVWLSLWIRVEGVAPLCRGVGCGLPLSWTGLALLVILLKARLRVDKLTTWTLDKNERCSVFISALLFMLHRCGIPFLWAL